MFNFGEKKCNAQCTTNMSELRAYKSLKMFACATICINNKNSYLKKVEKYFFIIIITKFLYSHALLVIAISTKTYEGVVERVDK